jgi:hypothetical protein
MPNMAGPQLLQLVWEAEFELYILLDLNAMPIKKRWSIAPLTNRNYRRSDKQRRPTHRFEALEFPVLADHDM